MSLVAKFFIQSRTEHGPGSVRYTLGVVCRGEENKDWAAATPAGSLECPPDADGVLDTVWASTPREVLVYTQPDPEGHWRFEKCEFSYGGVNVEFRGTNTDTRMWLGKLQMTVNNSGATRVLRDEFARSLQGNQPATFTLIFRQPE